MDEDIGWNDFLLRNYDPQVGRWVQQDPYQQYASPYVGMGDDPVNLIDPSGGFSVTGMAAGAVIGGMVGGVIDMVSGHSGGRGFLTGMVMGAGIGSGSGFWTMTNTVLQTANAVVQTISQAGAAKQAGNTYGNAQYASYNENIDPEPSTETWVKFTTDRLRHLAYRAGRGGGEDVNFNQIVGLEFERAIREMFNLRKGGTYQYNGKTCRPDFDGFSNELGIPKGRINTFPSGTFYERVDFEKFGDAKSGYKVTLEGNNAQIKTMIDAIAHMRSPLNRKKMIKDIGGGFLYLLTTSGVQIDSRIASYGFDNGVAVVIMEAYENPLKSGQIKFTKPRLLPSRLRSKELSPQTGQINFKKP